MTCLAVRVTFWHFLNILLVTQIRYIQCRRDLQKGANSTRQDLIIKGPFWRLATTQSFCLKLEKEHIKLKVEGKE